MPRQRTGKKRESPPPPLPLFLRGRSTKTYIPLLELGEPRLVHGHLAAQVVLRVREDPHGRLGLADLLVVADEGFDASLGVRRELELLQNKQTNR